MDLRFAVNTIAPLILTQALLPQLGKTGRVLNLSSAAQAPVSIRALMGEEKVSDNEAYAQSKLALTIWSRVLGFKYKMTGPAIIAINPKSLKHPYSQTISTRDMKIYTIITNPHV